ncbi:MAG: Adenine deaminase [Candidatus Moanabacter tarae]|uniref:adenine deaminase n=1 Tax=Candidatus Moanibacter tarae TaxID=2200854 RepID=A0A2Z4AHV8_9BACT|nr:MAG: Adenine deaminase [Candidatus Moanabacter tarae]|tara:strand:- start:37550 stop:39439 length:1890 start_codon:yes stop_codon:yes gene_type:complete
MKSLLAFLALLSLQNPSHALGEEKKFEFNEEIQIRQELMLVALGKSRADLILSGLTLLNVHTLTWNKNWDIVIKGNRIAWIGPRGKWNGTSNQTVEAVGYYAVPGFGESHKHIESSHLTPEFEAALVIPFGNTWTIEGSHEFSNVSGVHNVEFWLTPREHNSPLKIFLEMGSATPPTPYESGGGYYGYEEIRQAMSRDQQVVGLGEVMDWPRLWNRKLPGYERLWQVIQAAMDSRGVVEGHGAGLTELSEINAFAASGLESDHEVRLAEEAWDKVNRGVFLQIRYDVIQSIVKHFLDKGIQDWSHLSITTDDRDVSTSLKLGTSNYNLKLALDAGVPMEAAYAMVSLYPAKHAGIDHLVGSITPGRYADIVLLRNPQKVEIAKVYADGKLAAENGQYLLQLPKIEWPSWARNTINFGRKYTAEDFIIEAPSGKKEVKAAVLKPFHFKQDFLIETLKVKNGMVFSDAANGITKLALIDRYSGEGGISKMFWKEVGPVTPASALACSVAHDLHNVWVIGNDDTAMALAANTLADLQGGWVLVKNGNIVASVQFEIGGLMSARLPHEVAKDLDTLYAEADKMEWIGHPGLPRRMIFAFLTCTPWKWVLVAPSSHAPQGLVNVTNGKTHPVVW